MKNFLTNETGLQKVLIPQNRLQERVSGLGQEIAQAFDGKDLAIVAILKGSFIFAADLLRAMTTQCSIDFMGISSYVDKPSSGVVRITKDLDESIAGRNVLLVEDIIDTLRLESADQAVQTSLTVVDRYCAQRTHSGVLGGRCGAVCFEPRKPEQLQCGCTDSA